MAQAKNSTVKQPVYVVDVIGSVVDAAKTELGTNIDYRYGRQLQIQAELKRMDENVDQTVSGTKYPLLALFQDFPEKRGQGYYAVVTFPRIVIACLTNSELSSPERYPLTFKPILYPVYYAFLNQLAKSSNILETDASLISHTKWDRPGVAPVGGGVIDIVDSIEITNLTVTIIQQINC